MDREVRSVAVEGPGKSFRAEIPFLEPTRTFPSDAVLARFRASLRSGPSDANMYMNLSMTDEGMPDRHSIAEARRNLPTLVREAESGKVVELTRRGEPVAVLIGCRQFRRLAVGRRGFVKACRNFTLGFDLPRVGIDLDELFGAWPRFPVVRRAIPARHKCGLGTVAAETIRRHQA